MARPGRGFPLGTQYQALWRTVPSNPLAGDGTMQMAAVGAMTVVSAGLVSVETAPHRFRSVQVPPMTDLDAVQREMQRNLDEIARAVNPVRSVADGGTGLEEVTAGALTTGGSAAAMVTIPIGPNTYVLTSNGTMPSWQPSGGVGAGEANTASNQGVGGVGLVNGKVGVDLQFRNINAGSSKITVTLDAPNKEVDLDVATGTSATTVCVGNDIRLSDARTPTGAAGGDLTGTYPNPTFAVDMVTQAELTAALLGYQPVATTYAETVGSDRAETWGWTDDRSGTQAAVADTRAGIR